MERIYGKFKITLQHMKDSGRLKVMETVDEEEDEEEAKDVLGNKAEANLSVV